MQLRGTSTSLYHGFCGHSAKPRMPGASRGGPRARAAWTTGLVWWSECLEQPFAPPAPRTARRCIAVVTGAVGQEREVLAGIRPQRSQAGQARYDEPEDREQQSSQGGRPQAGEARCGIREESGECLLERSRDYLIHSSGGESACSRVERMPGSFLPGIHTRSQAGGTAEARQNSGPRSSDVCTDVAHAQHPKGPRFSAWSDSPDGGAISALLCAARAT